MTDNKQQEKSEEEKKKEANRNFALEMNKDENLKNLAAVYMIEQGDWGENIKSAAENSLYWTSIQEGMKYLNPESLKESREEEQRYTGSIKEKDILKDNFATFQTNLQYMKVNDVLNDIGANPDEKYGNEYVGELMKKDKKVGEGVLGLHQQAFGYNKVSESAKNYAGGLVEAVNENGLEKITKGDKNSK